MIPIKFSDVKVVEVSSRLIVSDEKESAFGVSIVIFAVGKKGSDVLNVRIVKEDVVFGIFVSFDQFEDERCGIGEVSMILEFKEKDVVIVLKDRPIFIE